MGLVAELEVPQLLKIELFSITKSNAAIPLQKGGEERRGEECVSSRGALAHRFLRWSAKVR
jgi:hypothetical protein